MRVFPAIYQPASTANSVNKFITSFSTGSQRIGNMAICHWTAYAEENPGTAEPQRGASGFPHWQLLLVQAWHASQQRGTRASCIHPAHSQPLAALEAMPYTVSKGPLQRPCTGGASLSQQLRSPLKRLRKGSRRRCLQQSPPNSRQE